MSNTDIERMAAASEVARHAGKRDEAIAIAREMVRLAPEDASGWRSLSYAITHGDIYRYNAGLREQLAADGSLTEAIAAGERAAELGGATSEEFLQIGYCQTALGDYAAAAASIRRASDLYLAETRPDLAGQVTSESPVLQPSFFIVGAHKCGTTSLFNYLAQHPLVLPPAVKEVEYFTQPERGLPWFLAHFPRTPRGKKTYRTGEASVASLNARKVPQRIKDFAPDARIFVLVRNPTERAISHYQNYRNLGIETRPLDQAIFEELELLGDGKQQPPEAYWKTQQGYLRIGKYANDLEWWLSIFPKEQIQILVTEELQEDPKGTLEQALRHLGLPNFKMSKFARHHKGSYDDQDQSAVRQRLDAFFAFHNERLYEVLGRRPDWGQAREVHTAVVPRASEARVLYAKGLWAEAAAAFGACLSENPSHPERAEWYDKQSAALISAKDLNGAVDCLKAFDREYPDNPQATLGLLRISRLTNNLPATLSLLEDCLRRFPAHKERKNWMQLLGQTLLDQKQLNRAAQAFELMTAAYPGESSGVVGLARVAQEQGQIAHALQLWGVYTQRFPQDPGRRWWLVTYAHLLIREGDFARAEQFAAQHRAEYPDEPGGLACLARLEQQRGNIAKAMALWEECLGRFPDHAERHWWQTALANLLIDEGRLDHAEAFLDDVIISFPNEPGGMAGLARIATRRGQSAEAADIWEECLRRFPSHPDRRWWFPTLAHLLLSIKETDRGEAKFRQMLDEFPGDPVAIAGLARAAGDRGQWEDSRRLLQQCISSHPNHPNKGEWEKMLRNAEARLSEQRTVPST